MMRITRSFTVAALAALALLGLGAPSVRAQAQFGAVDFPRCVEESKANQEALKDMTALQKDLNVVLSKLGQPGVALLSRAEITELYGLYEKTAPSEAEKKRTGELEAKADLQIGTLKRLETTNPLSEDQKKQLQTLLETQQNAQQTLQEIQRGYQKRLEDKELELSNKVGKVIREAVAKVAKEKNLVLVFGANQVLYAQIDITEDVLKIVK